VRSLRWASSNPITDPLQCQVLTEINWNAHFDPDRGSRCLRRCSSFLCLSISIVLSISEGSAGEKNPSLVSAKTERNIFLGFQQDESEGEKKMRLFLSCGAV
jgi:hypothetical protein